MALKESSMMPLGTKAPDFTLYNAVSGKNESLMETQSDLATVIVFICNHCPFVLHINAALVKVANTYQAKNVKFIAISSNNIESHPQDGPDKMKIVADKEGYPFPYLYDESQEVAKAYQATCTPDFFVFDKDMKCAYRGRFDETRPNMGQANGKDLSAALETLIAGQKASEVQHPSMGCNIKWK
jgi:peroxiredoxin